MKFMMQVFISSRDFGAELNIHQKNSLKTFAKKIKKKSHVIFT